MKEKFENKSDACIEIVLISDKNERITVEVESIADVDEKTFRKNLNKLQVNAKKQQVKP